MSTFDDLISKLKLKAREAKENTPSTTEECNDLEEPKEQDEKKVNLKRKMVSMGVRG